MRLIDADALTKEIQENKLLAREYAAQRILKMIVDATMYITPKIAMLTDGWIPVAERLPEEDKEVMITLINGNVTWAFRFQGEWHLPFQMVTDDYVTARRELPTPYKESDEE